MSDKDYEIPIRKRIAFAGRSYSKRYYLTHPWKYVSWIWSEITDFFHRGVYGYSRLDAWNMYSYISNISIGMLHQLRDEGEKELELEWKRILSQMIVGFDSVSENRLYHKKDFNEYYEYFPKEGLLGSFSDEGIKRLIQDEDKLREQSEKALELFAKHFYSLWD